MVRRTRFDPPRAESIGPAVRWAIMNQRLGPRRGSTQPHADGIEPIWKSEAANTLNVTQVHRAGSAVALAWTADPLRSDRKGQLGASTLRPGITGPVSCARHTIPGFPPP